MILLLCGAALAVGLQRSPANAGARMGGCDSSKSMDCIRFEGNANRWNALMGTSRDVDSTARNEVPPSSKRLTLREG
jgi:hypothetical protein